MHAEPEGCLPYRLISVDHFWRTGHDLARGQQMERRRRTVLRGAGPSDVRSKSRSRTHVNHYPYVCVTNSPADRLQEMYGDPFFHDIEDRGRFSGLTTLRNWPP